MGGTVMPQQFTSPKNTQLRAPLSPWASKLVQAISREGVVLLIQLLGGNLIINSVNIQYCIHVCMHITAISELLSIKPEPSLDESWSKQPSLSAVQISEKWSSTTIEAVKERSLKEMVKTGEQTIESDKTFGKLLAKFPLWRGTQTAAYDGWTNEISCITLAQCQTWCLLQTVPIIHKGPSVCAYYSSIINFECLLFSKLC